MTIASAFRAAACIALVSLAAVVAAAEPASAAPAGASLAQPVLTFGIPVDFILFGLTLLGVAWGFLAYAVGFGGSMIRFGSSAGVAISNMYPEAKSVGRWLRHGWFIAVAHVVGSFVMLAIIGWNPDAQRKRVDLPSTHITMGNV